MKISRLISLMILLAAIFSSCEKDDPDNELDTGFTYGAFITNEGGFGNSNGSISYLDQDSLIMYNNLFQQVNGRPLGDVVQSVSIHEERAYIVVNNSQKVEVVDLETFSSLGLIQGLSYPRYFLGIDAHKGYVSNGASDGLVYVVDLDNLSIIDSIAVGSGPEQMLLYNKQVYVANSGGGGNDSTLSVIDINQDKLIETMEVGFSPVSMVKDVNNDLWVLCKGKVVWGADWSIEEETESELVRINITSNTIESRMSIGNTGDYIWPSGISVSKGRNTILFTEQGGVYEISLDATIQPINPLIPSDFYGFGVDPETGVIYGLSAGNFTENGFLKRYQADGTKIDSVSVGIGPNSVVFN